MLRVDLEIETSNAQECREGISDLDVPSRKLTSPQLLPKEPCFAFFSAIKDDNNEDDEALVSRVVCGECTDTRDRSDATSIRGGDRGMYIGSLSESIFWENERVALSRKGER